MQYLSTLPSLSESRSPKVVLEDTTRLVLTLKLAFEENSVLMNDSFSVQYSYLQSLTLDESVRESKTTEQTFSILNFMSIML